MWFSERPDPKYHHWPFKPFIMQDFERLKKGPFSQMAKTIILCDSKRSSFIIFFKIQFDTAALIIHSFRMIKARGCKQRFESDLLRVEDNSQYYIPGTKYCIIQSSIARPTAAVLMT